MLLGVLCVSPGSEGPFATSVASEGRSLMAQSNLPSSPDAFADRLEREREWLRRIQAGSHEARDTLYVALVPSLYTFAQRFVPADAAEDVVQDVMLDLWDRREGLMIRGSIRGYLFGAVKRRIAGHKRHEGVVRNVTDAMTHGVIPMLSSALPSMTPADAAEASELEQRVTVALATLSTQSRLILTLHWIEGLSYAEIADTLGISVAAAKKQGRRMEVVIRNLLAHFAPG